MLARGTQQVVGIEGCMTQQVVCIEGFMTQQDCNAGQVQLPTAADLGAVACAALQGYFV